MVSLKVFPWCVSFKTFLLFIFKGPNTQHSGHMGHNFQTELMVEICFKSIVRAIGKVLLLMDFS